MSFIPKKMLVTGGAGFIGSHFILNYLHDHPELETLVNVDCLSYAANLNNLTQVKEDSRYHFIKGNICDRDLVTKILNQYEIDTIVHFAAESHVDRSIKQASPFIETNILGTFILIDCAKTYWLIEKKWQAAQCRFHHISTDEVYGSLTETDPTFTETTRYQPRSPYSASKASSDHLVQAYYHTYGLPITMSHCSNNYGPHQDSEKFIPTIIHACLTQKNIPIYGEGKQIRDWLYVSDHCEAIDLILQRGKLGETYHIGGSNEWKNIDLVHHLCELMDEHFPEHAPHQKLITFVTDRLGHDYRYGINHEKITKDLGWQPKTSFDAGLRKTIGFLCKI